MASNIHFANPIKLYAYWDLRDKHGRECQCAVCERARKDPDIAYYLARSGPKDE